MLDEIISYCSHERFRHAISESMGLSKRVSFLSPGNNSTELGGYSLKTDANDFMVEEVLNPEFCPREEAKYTWLLIEKTNLSTHDAARLVSNALNVRISEVGRAGIKDKRAVAIQWLSVPGAHENARERLERIPLMEGKMRVLETGFGKEGIAIGAHDSNRFRIVLREVSKETDIQTGVHCFPNYFDTQRVKLSSAIMGELIWNIKKKDTKSVEIFLSRIEGLPLSMKKADSMTRWACRLLEERGQGGVRGLMERLSKYEKREYLSSLSCCLWNYKLSQFLKESEPQATEALLEGNALGTMVLAGPHEEIVKSEQIGFQGRNIEREAFCKANVERVSWEKENGKYVCTIEMELPKGAYATMFLKWVFAKACFGG